MERHLQKFLLHLQRRGLSGKTIKAYRKDLQQFLSHCHAAGPEEVTTLTIRSFLAEMVARGLSRRSLARKLSTLRSFFKYLVDSGGLAANPAGSMRTPRFQRNLPSFLDLEQAKKLVEAPRGSDVRLSARDAAMLELMYSSGMRVAELVSIDKDEIDLRSGVVRIIGKGAKERLVPIGSYARKALETCLRRRKAAGGERALFVNRFGRRITARSVRRIVTKYAMRAGLASSVSPHTLRHTFATHMLDSGCDLRTVQEILGHSSLSTTQVYTHVTTRRMQEVYQKAHPRS